MSDKRSLNKTRFIWAVKVKRGVGWKEVETNGLVKHGRFGS